MINLIGIWLEYILILRWLAALGKEIEVLVNQDLSPGRHDVEFNGEQYPSGIYFYRIIIDSDKSEDEVYIETRYMILLK